MTFSNHAKTALCEVPFWELTLELRRRPEFLAASIFTVNDLDNIEDPSAPIDLNNMESRMTEIGWQFLEVDP